MKTLVRGCFLYIFCCTNPMNLCATDKLLIVSVGSKFVKKKASYIPLFRVFESRRNHFFLLFFLLGKIVCLNNVPIFF